MTEYVVPSLSVYQSRRLFHTNQRNRYESMEEWFNRIDEILNDCDYGELADFMFIDKFISGLNTETFEQFPQNTTLTINEILSIGIKHSGNDLSPLSYHTDSKDTKFQFLNVDIINQNDSNIEREDNLRYQIADEMTENEQMRMPCESFSPTKSNACESDASMETIQPIEQHDFSKRNLSTIAIKGFKQENYKKIICLDCDKNFTEKNSYYYHRRKHTGENLRYCNICGRVFVKQSQLAAHLHTHEHDNKYFECYLCLSKFDRLHGLRIHFKLTHTVKIERNLQCPTCQKLFSKQRDLDFHIKIHQGLVNGQKCQHCGKLYDRLSNLKEHLKSHQNTKEFVCEICGHAFRRKSVMTKHMQTHNDSRQFKCCECDQILKNSQTLKNHMRQHTGERPFKCDQCEKTFVTRPSLIKHIRVHRRERPFCCMVCNKRFATNYHLKVHGNTHTGAKPYTCDHVYCGRSYTQLGSLKTHQSKSHANELMMPKIF